MQDGWTVAVVGATGLVGRQICEVLEQRQFPLRGLRLLASADSAGESLQFAGRTLRVAEVSAEQLQGCDLVLMAAGEQVARTFGPVAVAAGAWVVDNSAAWRGQPQVPLVVPEVNGQLLATCQGPAIIANPNCVAIQLAVALAPLHRAFGLRRLTLSTYQAVSGVGQQGMSELGDQVSALWRGADLPTEVFGRRMAFDLLAQIGALNDAGDSGEEVKVAAELRRLLAIDDLQVTVTCVRVPTFNGHGAAVVADFAAPADVASASALMHGAAGLSWQPGLSLPPSLEAINGQDAVAVGRLRQPSAQPHTLALWCVADNLRKGAATNAVQIAEGLARRCGAGKTRAAKAS